MHQETEASGLIEQAAYGDIVFVNAVQLQQIPRLDQRRRETNGRPLRACQHLRQGRDDGFFSAGETEQAEILGASFAVS